MTCAWCHGPLDTPRARYCSRKCRQAAFRLRKRAVDDAGVDDTPRRFAYADPPYIGRARKWYAGQASYGGEVDHEALISELERRRVAKDLHGWALSCAVDTLWYLLPLCPRPHRVCAWAKPQGVPKRSRGIHNTWEALIVVGGRQRPPGRPDFLRAQPARGGGKLPGRKPIAFCAWIFGLLGMQPGDELEDLFPGTGVVGRAWLSLGGLLVPAPSDVAGSTSPTGRPRPGPGDASSRYRSDDRLSSPAPGDTVVELLTTTDLAIAVETHRKAQLERASGSQADLFDRIGA